MSRDIKFRVWQDGQMTLLNEMYVGVRALGFSDNCYVDLDWSDHEDVVIMQYTGLKDKNGVEIYEGDIVSSPSMPNSPIEYQRGSFNGVYADDSHDEWEAPIWRYAVEVIGNIYENPELLKKDN